MKITDKSTLSSIRFQVPSEFAKWLSRAQIDNLFIAPSLKRSGHHAVIDWILNQFSGLSSYYNYANKHPAVELLDRCDSRWVSSLDIPCNPWIKAAGINFENLSIDKILAEGFLEECRMSFPYAGCQWFLLVLRDAYNNFASCEMRKPGTWDGQLWKSYAHLFLADDSNLGIPMVKINFNRWFSDVSYKHSLANVLSCDTFQPAQERVSHFGDGSSFSKLCFDGSASRMKVNDRWRQIPRELKVRMRIEMDDSIHRLNSLIFGCRYVEAVLEDIAAQ